MNNLNQKLKPEDMQKGYCPKCGAPVFMCKATDLVSDYLCGHRFLYSVMAISKITSEEVRPIEENLSYEDAHTFCEQWGWNYDDGEESYWTGIKPETADKGII